MVEHNQSTYNGGQYNNAYKFNGKELDDATQMYYYGARYYDPRISIFVSVDPLAEETMEPYLYVGNNPIRYVDPTGMSKDDWIFYFTNGFLTGFEDTGKGSAIHIVNDGKSYNPNSFSDLQRKSQRNQIVNYVEKKINNKVNFSYKELNNKGGHYDKKNNEIVVTHSTVNQNNIYDLTSVIEHEDFHFQNGSVNSFKDHVKVYMQQAGTSAFQKSSDGNKYTNAVAIGQRMLNSYVADEIDGQQFTNMANDYNKLNPSNAININWSSSADKTSVTIGQHKKEYYYDKNLKPHE